MKSFHLPALATIALATSMAACSGPQSPTHDATHAPSPTQGPPKAGSDSTHLTIHNDGYEQLAGSGRASAGMPGHAQVDRPLRIGLEAGANEIMVDDLPPAMDVEGATLQWKEGGAGVEIAGQRYLAPPAGNEEVLARAIGQHVSVEHTAGGAKQSDVGRLLAVDDGITLVLDDGRIKVIRQYDSFTLVALDKAIPRRATLQWNIVAQRAGDADFVLSYPTGGLAWRAEYLARLAKADDGACRLTLEGAALIANRSGLDFDKARVSLVAGGANIERIQATGSRLRDGFAQAQAAPAPPAPVERVAGESHAYDLPGAVRLANDSTERVPVFAARPDVACERNYVVESDGIDWQPPQPLIDAGFRGQTGDVPVVTTVTLHNTREAGLGQALPAGRVRVFDGTDLLGESMLPHTATGAEIRLPVGKAFDLSARREATHFHLDRTGRTITESFSVVLRNAKARTATVRVIEPLSRWSDWWILDSSVAAKRKDARHVQFDVPVPAGGNATLTYTVRYRWTQDVNP